MEEIKITCISENTVRRHSLLASHGQSLFIKYKEKEYLLDTGEIYQSFVFNAKELNITADSLDAIVLTHNHLDHSGALFKFISNLSGQTLYLPPDMEKINEMKYSPLYRDGMSKEESIEKIFGYPHTRIVNEPLQLGEGLYVTGPLPGEDCVEQSLIMNIAGKGLVIVVGCSHPGLSTIIKRAQEVTGEEKIYGLVGGFHLLNMDDAELEKQISFLQNLQTTFIVPSHCTGFKAIRKMQDVMRNVIKVSETGQFGVGNTLSISPELQFDFK